MTEETNPHSARLDSSPRPIAIVHEGFFVYANTAFLDRLAYRSFDDLQAVPLLDMVEESHHEQLREHLDAAKKTAGTDRHQAEAKLTLRRANDLPLHADCTSFRTRYAGEDCIQLNLSSAEDHSLGHRVRKLPWRLYLSLAFLVLFSVLPSALLLNLNINNAPDVYFPANEPAVVLDRELRERFPNDQVFVLLFEGVALFSDGFSAAYDALARKLERLEAVDDVVATTSQDHIAGTQEDFVVEPLIDPKKFAKIRPEERRQRVLDDQLSGGMLAADDGSALAMIIIPNEAGNSIERLALEEEILGAVAEARLDGYLIAMAGQIPVDVAQLRSMLRDNMIFIPATVGTGLLMIWWLFRRWIAVMLAGIAIGVVVNSTVAFYVLLDQPFTLVSSIIPPLLSALTIAALVHLFNGMLLASKRGLSGSDRVARAVAEVERPARYAAFTTAAGLASLASSPIVPIRTFGLISALGALLIYLVVFRILPTLLVRWDNARWPSPKGGTFVVDRIVSSLYRTGIRHPIAVIGGVVLLLAIGVPQIYSVVVETNLQEFFQSDHPVREHTRRIDEKLVGTTTASVIFNVDQRDGLKDPEKLRFIRDFQHWAEAQPEIDRSFGLPNFLEEMNWAFNTEDPEFRRLPEDSQLISQYLLIYDGDDIHDFVDRDYQRSHIALNLNVHDAGAITEVLDRIRDYLQQHARDDLSWEIAGHARMFADMADLVVTGQVYSLVGALILISLFMVFFLRSAGAAALCMIPNLSPILLIFIMMGSFGVWLDMATAMIASLAVGIAVDDTIHVYHGFQHRLARGISPVVALARTHRQAGRAVVVTTIILSTQFLIVGLSDFVPTRNFGMLTTVGLIAALLFDLLLLPALLIVIHGGTGPVAMFSARLFGGGKPAASEADDGPLGFDDSYWTTERKTTLVKEILSGRSSALSAAREFTIPRAEIEKWIGTAEKGIAAALEGRPVKAARDPAKVRALAKAYKKLKAENRALKARQRK